MIKIHSHPLEVKSEILNGISFNYIVTIEKNTNKICNMAYNYEYYDIIYCNTKLKLSSIIISTDLVVMEKYKIVLKRISKNLSDLIKNISNLMKSMIIPETFEKTVFGTKSISLKIIFKEMLYDSLCKICIPYTRVAKVYSYGKSVEKFFNDIFISTFPEITPYSSVLSSHDDVKYFLENITNKEDSLEIENDIFSNK